MPKVTICIPAYNASGTIAATIESLLSQTYRDLEVIVSDNHSSDDTAYVVGRFKGQGVRLVVCPEPPVRTGSALDNCLSAIQNWNSLCELGTGEYVGIYHADDLFEPGLVSRQVEILERHPDCAAVFPTFRRIDAEGRLMDFVVEGANVPTQEWYTQVQLIRKMLRVGHNLSSSGPLIRRGAWRRAGRLDAARFEQAADTEFWIRLSGVGPVVLTRPAMVRYRVHPGQDSPNGFRLYRFKPLPIILVLRYWAAQESVSKQLGQEDALHLAASRAEEDLRVAINLFHDGREEEARRLLGESAVGAGELRWLAKEGRRLATARLLAGKALLLASHFGAGSRLAALIGRSRVGFPGWP